MLCRFLELLTLSLLIIPILRCIAYNSNNILVELNIRDAFEYFQEV